jgi:hypothetical protein
VNGVAPTALSRQAGAGGILIGIYPKPSRAGLTFSGHPPGLRGKPFCHRSKGTTCPHPARSVRRRFLVGVSLSRSQRTVHASLMRTVRFRKPGWRGLSWFFGWCPDWHLGSGGAENDPGPSRNRREETVPTESHLQQFRLLRLRRRSWNGPAKACLLLI